MKRISSLIALIWITKTLHDFCDEAANLNIMLKLVLLSIINSIRDLVSAAVTWLKSTLSPQGVALPWRTTCKLSHESFVSFILLILITDLVS